MHYRDTRKVAIVGGNRIPFCRSYTGYVKQSNLDMMTATLNGLVSRYKLDGLRLGDVALGAVMKHSRDWNMAREAVLGTKLAPETPAYDLQRACGTGLEAAIQVGNKIALGQIDAGIAGGTDSVSDTPIVYPDSYRSILLESFVGKSTAAKLKPWLRLRPS
ncbi:MAG: acetyl-CoA C-acetyltransferase, partial [Gammaproteobacteria bacterium]